MAWYGNGGSWYGYRPYVSVAQKKAIGASTLTKLLKKSRRTAEPVMIQGRRRRITTTFWGSAARAGSAPSSDCSAASCPRTCWPC
jgi:hypothetical protein